MENNSALVFSSGNRCFGVEASMVVEVVYQQYISFQSPVVEPFFAATKIRGQQIPVICTCQLLGMEKKKASCSGNLILIKIPIEGQLQIVGLMVDVVEGTLRYTNSEVMGLSGLFKGDGVRRMIDGVVYNDDLPVYLLNVDRMIGLDSLADSGVKESASVA
jgi:chemotaxis signal transduction protein